MKAQSLDQLRSQSRASYRYWHIYLMLRLREVEQHLTPGQRAELGSILPKTLSAHTPDIALLVEYGLFSGDEILLDIPSPEPIFCDDSLMFQVSDSSLYAHLEYQRLELMRVSKDRIFLLHDASAILNDMLNDLSADVVLESARLWAVLQGAKALNWQASSVNHPPQQTLLPPRKRGKGVFRDSL